MAAKHQSRPRPSTVRRTDRADTSSEKAGTAALWFIMGMVAVAVLCLLMGSLRHGFDWRSTLSASGCLLTAIGSVAIGLWEWEWLERLMGFTGGLFSGLVQWFWMNWFGSLSDSELVGRRGATVIWVSIGFLVFVWGCLLGLRVVSV